MNAVAINVTKIPSTLNLEDAAMFPSWFCALISNPKIRSIDGVKGPKSEIEVDYKKSDCGSLV